MQRLLDAPECGTARPRLGAALFVSCVALTSACRDHQGTASAAPGPALQPSAQPAASARLVSTAAPAPSASSASAKAFYADRYSKKPYPPDVMELGRALFFDPALSASQKMACSSCHDPRFAFGPPDDHSTELGGADLKSPGLRAVPSLRYLQKVPPFVEHYFDEAIDDSIDNGPTGGHTWDGRADTLHDQAKIPLISPFEMANDSIDSVVAKVKQATYAARFKQIFGDDVFDDADRASSAVLLSLEVFQDSPKDFYPYTSRYDASLRNQAELSASEQRGLTLFNDPAKGNCVHCHESKIRRGAFPQFSDFGYQALGIPRNPAVASNRDPKFFDQGLCGPLRTDLASHHEYCGEFRVPTLRNVAVRKSFFHNGVFHQLQQVLEFYAERDTNPKKWYPTVAGHVDAFDDLPLDARKNVNSEAPFGRKLGQAPALSKSEIQDMIAFLDTLTDEDQLPAKAK